ncbi:hypothetical protein HGRIS_010065 [Hohenbuehelia grisea]|uniref:F-box domain-containing protein n=1 Tax=Hohenbuehelia grisea TaxID=104357 RepID=A0ABR3J365_9AGAR
MVKSFFKKYLFRHSSPSTAYWPKPRDSDGVDWRERGAPSLPFDVYLEIAEFIEPQAASDLLALASASQAIYNLLLPVLYRRVNLHSSRECHSTLELISRRPELASCILELTVHPHEQDDLDVSRKIEHLASQLTSLRVFNWNGAELPQSDTIWRALRTSCPKLRSISTPATYRSPTTGVVEIMPPDSHLYDFKNLSSFTLVFQTRQSGRRLPVDDQPVSLPSKFWEMILHESPNLEQLHFQAQQTRPIIMVPLLTGRFPNLHSLTLGDLYYPSSVDDDSDVHQPLTEFLTAHHSLSQLILLGSTSVWNPWRFPIPHPTLLQVHQFSADVEFVLRHGRSLGHVTRLCLNALPTYFEAPWDHVLKPMVSLTSLKVIAGTSNRLLYFIDNCAPLSHLEIERLENPPTAKTMKSISAVLKSPNLASLRTLVLGFGNSTLEKWVDHDMQAHARRVFRAIPRLGTLTLKYSNFRPGFSDILLQQGVFERSLLDDTIAVREVSYVHGHAAAKRYRLPQRSFLG